MFNTKLIFLGAIFVAGLSNGATQDADHLTLEQREALAQLKEILKGELTESYMREDYWLILWLKLKDFKVEETVKIIRQYLEYRREQNLNQILDEDWSDMRALFTYSRDTFDKSGKPVLYVDMGQWDISSFLTSEETFARLIRYILLLIEESDAQVRSLRAEGRNITQSTEIINVGGFVITKHVCIQCVYFYHNVTQLFAPYLPVTMERADFINVPFIFKMAYIFFSDDFKKFIRLHGQDQKELEKMLLDYLDRDQFPKGILDQLDEEENSDGFLTWNREL